MRRVVACTLACRNDLVNCVAYHICHKSYQFNATLCAKNTFTNTNMYTEVQLHNLKMPADKLLIIQGYKIKMSSISKRLCDFKNFSLEYINFSSKHGCFIRLFTRSQYLLSVVNFMLRSNSKATIAKVRQEISSYINPKNSKCSQPNSSAYIKIT